MQVVRTRVADEQLVQIIWGLTGLIWANSYYTYNSIQLHKMASANVPVENPFLKHIRRVRVELREKVARAHQVLQERERQHCCQSCGS